MLRSAACAKDTTISLELIVMAACDARRVADVKLLFRHLLIYCGERTLVSVLLSLGRRKQKVSSPQLASNISCCDQ
jgi:hypothetical protein